MLEELKNELSKILSEKEIIVDEIYTEKKGKYNILTIVLDKVGGIDLDTIVDATTNSSNVSKTSKGISSSSISSL